MNKDAILATIIGFGVGLVIAGLVFLGPTVLKNLPPIHLPNFAFIQNLFQKTPKLATSPTPKATSHGLTVESPLPDSIESRNETLISGNTKPNAIVVLEGENGELVVVANPQGAYAGKLSLGEGKNELHITSYNGSDRESQTVTVFYTPENF